MEENTGPETLEGLDLIDQQPTALDEFPMNALAIENEFEFRDRLNSFISYFN